MAAKTPPADPAVEADAVPIPEPVWPTGAATASATAAAARAGGNHVRARAGKLPVWVGPASKPTSTPRARVATATQNVKVEFLNRDIVEQADIAGLLLRLSDADDPSAPGSVSLSVGYGGFGSAFGADWASRLRIVQMPDCVLSTPTVEECQQGEPLLTTNSATGRSVTADVTFTPTPPGSSARRAAVDGGGSVFAVTAGASGGGGDYSATSLSPSASWQVSENTGSFTWSYPLRVPPGVNGPSPELSISYSSGSVDGRTASTNNQPSWLGEGHSLESGYVERKYLPCRDDMTGGNNTKKTDDECWKTDNATLVFGGQSSELVKDSDGTWKLEDDDASRMQRLHGATNSDNDKEYWKLTTTDGTQYFFGLGKRYATDSGPNTDSTWTVPVFGNQPGEPCRAATFAASACQQAWRWNLDYVIDPHGNTMTYYYQAETNRYGQNNNTTKPTPVYDRGGWLKLIDYGERKGSEGATPAPAQVVFGTAERCVPTATFDCAESKLTKSTALRWPDVAQDQICTSTTSCANQKAPTYFSRKRLVSVTTQIRSGAGYVPVDTWKFGHLFPDPGDRSTRALWLQSITHQGRVGGTAALPPVVFTGAQRQNRVDGIDTAPPLIKWRVAGINSETGGRTWVEYSDQDPTCTPRNVPTPHANTRRCFPVYWAEEGREEPRLHYFHKYVVTAVTEDDLTGGGLAKRTAYQYLDAPAWAYDDNELTLPKHRTWGLWRGYERVQVRIGTPGIDTLSLTESRYMRGMDGDHLPGGAKREASVTDSWGGSIADHPRTSGFLREQRVFNGVGGSEVSSTLNDPWISAATATSGTKSAHLLQIGKIRTRTPLASGGARTTETASTFDAYGLPTVVNDQGDTSTPADDLCMRTTYVRNTTAWILATTSRLETLSVKCTAGTAPTAEQIVSDVRMYHDGSDDLAAAPTRGDVTRTDTLSDGPDGRVYKTTKRVTHDAHGRVHEAFDALGHKTTTTYVPAEGGPVTEVHTTNPKEHLKKTLLHEAWGTPEAEIDPNDKRTDLTYDPLGRLTAVWLPGQSKSANPPAKPNLRFTYLLRTNGPVAITTQKLKNDGTYRASHQLFDGLLRPRQTQAPGADGTGRVVTETIYDGHGRVLDNNGPHYNEQPPSTDLFQVTDAQIPSQTRTTYDGAGRPRVEEFRSLGVKKWWTTTDYGGDRVHVTPPQGGTATTTITDARGRTTALRQYHAPTPTGDYDQTTYTYAPDGKAKTVTDPVGNQWSYEYDLRGRQTKAHDPDRGTTITTYDDADRVATVTDARGQTIAYAYDVLGRRTASHKDSADGPLLASWTFDTVAKGKPASSTRWVNGKGYTTAVTGYDDMYRATSSTITIPTVDGETELAGTYTEDFTYNLDGGIKTNTLPRVPGLNPETLNLYYDANGNLDATTGNGAYVSRTDYSPYGEVLQMALGNTIGKTSWQTFFYENGTRRLDRARVDRMGFSGSPNADTRYTYDPAGTVTRIADTPAGETPDVQCFTHDHLRRLTEAWTATDNCASAPTLAKLGGPAPYWHTYTYDLTGNRKQETQHSPAGDSTRTYTYPAPKQPRPHAVAEITTTGPAGTNTRTFDYDETGNTTRRHNGNTYQQLTWDEEGRLATATSGTNQSGFTYGADGARLIRRDPDAVTLYLGSTEVRLDKKTRALTSTRYYTHGGKTIAVRTAAGMQTLASDHHGTAQLSIHPTTQTVTRRRTMPFGVPRGTPQGTWIGERGFVGGTNDTATGLTHLGAREYDPQLGRFISVDPIIDFGNPQQMNGYAYASNSPATLSDPTGLFECNKCDGSEHPSDFDPLPKRKPKPAPSGPDLDVRGGYDVDGNYRIRINGYTLPKARYNLHAMLIHIRKNFHRVHEEPGELGDLLKIIRLVGWAYDDVGFKGSESHYVSSQIKDDATVAAIAMDVEKRDGNLTRAQVALLETISMGAGVYLGVRMAVASAQGRSSTTAASSAANGDRLRTHLHLTSKYGQAGVRELESGRIRYYGELSPASKPGEMVGRRLVREWDPSTGGMRTWHETLDGAGNVRIVRPETGGPKVHHQFDRSGGYVGSW